MTAATARPSANWPSRGSSTAPREGQAIELGPLDDDLGLPEGDFSSVLEDWARHLCLRGSFAGAGQSLEDLLGPRLGARTLEPINRAIADSSMPFRDAAEVPPAA